MGFPLITTRAPGGSDDTPIVSLRGPNNEHPER